MSDSIATRLLFCCLIGFFSIQSSNAAEDTAFQSSDGTELSMRQYPASGNRLYIWLPGEAGIQTSEYHSAQILARDFNTEVWLVDLFESHFLPVVSSSLNHIPASDIKALIDAAKKKNKPFYFVTTGDGIRPLLAGIHQWQSKQPFEPDFHGLILLSPKFYSHTPDPGQQGQLLPIVTKTNLPVYLLQAKLSPWYWKLSETVPALENSGSDVFVHLLPGLRDRFYYRPDATAYELEFAENLPKLLHHAGRMLASLPGIERKVKTTSQPIQSPASGKKERKLRPYQGNPHPPALKLPGLTTASISLDDYRGQVVLVNFWASWCPPCVHEMPSMQRLQNKLQAKPFTILAVNMAEDHQTIQTFLDTKVNVTFPVLMDRDGSALTRWQVFAFPTSYLLDKNGMIRYALFGSIEWDTEEQLEIIQKLLDE